MKSLPRLLLSVSCLAALVTTAALPASAKEEMKAEKKITASIRPAGEVKPADLPALAKITFEQALKAALAAVPGSVIKAELEIEDGNLMYAFEIVTAKKTVTEVEIDAGTGKVLDIDVD